MKNRLIAYLVMGGAYLLACLVFLAVFGAFTVTGGYELLIALFVADVAATVVIWLFGIIFKNSSFYDAYWSLIPWLILLFVMIRGNFWNLGSILLFAVITIWSFRLTINWAYTCKSLKTEDWRYTKYRSDNPRVLWHIINFFGINLMPTILVFLGLIPAIVFVSINPTFSPLHLVGAAIILLGTAFEYFADNQMHSFLKRAKKGEVIDSGLWKYSRHPNYLGEIMIWLGTYVFLVLTDSSFWYLFIGFVAMVILFTCISIPMMEKRQILRRPEYREYQKTTSGLLLLPKRKSGGCHRAKRG